MELLVFLYFFVCVFGVLLQASEKKHLIIVFMLSEQLINLIRLSIYDIY